MTVEEYLVLERQAETMNEYIDGEMIQAPSGNWAHALILGNLAAMLTQQLKRRPERAYIRGLRVRSFPSTYVYPDLMVVTGEPLLEDEHRDTLLNPILIAEVLSPSTESYDRGRKFEGYQTLESLREYVLVAQDRPRVEHYLRQDGHVWLYTDVSGLDSSVSFASIGCEIPLAEIYDKVTFS